MRVVENLSAAILESLEKNDIESYIDYRDKLIIRVVDQDYFSIENIENHFIVGKALALILDDMYNKQPLLYKRIVLSAVYCLLKVIIRDRYNKGQSYECCSVIFSKPSIMCLDPCIKTWKRRWVGHVGAELRIACA